jgi:glycosyltransferase involved in cell wall biosynthesis
MKFIKNKNLKVCFLLGMFYPVTNGAIIQISSLSKKLVKHGASISIITTKFTSKQRFLEKRDGVKIIRTGPAVGVKRIGKFIKLLPLFIVLISERKKYDILIVCDFAVRGVIGVIVSKILRKKCLLRAETNGEMDGSYATLYNESSGNIKYTLIHIIIKVRNIILKLSDGFISISNDITKELIESGVSRKKIYEIANGIDINKYYPVEKNRKLFLKEKFGPPRKRYFIYTGRLAKGKGLEYLLPAWKKLVSKHNNIHLFLIGSGQGYALSCEEDLKAFVKNNHMENSVTFTGNIFNVDEYLQAGDFYVLPSQSEGLSVSLLEALASGLPAIVTSVRGILDVIENNVNGILVPYGDEDKLYEGMIKVLINEAKAEEIGKNGKNTVSEKYNIDKISKQYIELFEQIYDS